MLHNFIFKTGYFFKRPNLLRYYKKFQKTQWQSSKLLKKQQEKQLKNIIHFAYVNVPYYEKLFNKANIKPDEIKTIKDLEKIPILTKEIIKKNWEEFIPKNIDKIKHINGSTGGSTGKPLKYRMSLSDYERSVALLYRGWGFGGYKLGDKVAVIGGSSLVPKSESKIKKNIQDFFLNFRHYSSFEMSEKNLKIYFNKINKWKPYFLRGYASSIYLFAQFIQNNKLKLKFQPKAIFTTAEKLFYQQRKIIEQTFNTKVFDNYGLNDGGISAYECKNHKGMHIDTERSILEIIDDNNKQILNKEGKILATSLYNYALPFIRYETGDMGIVSNKNCGCKRSSLVLKKISGRVTDFLKINNIIIGSPVLTVLMGKFDIKQYQIIQNKPKSIVIKIVTGKNYNKLKDEQFIKESLYSHVGTFKLIFEYKKHILTTGDQKYKFIINNLKK